MELKLLQKSNSKNSRSNRHFKLFCNKIADKITKVSKSLPKNNLEIVKSKTEILKEWNIWPEKKQSIVADLMLIQ